MTCGLAKYNLPTHNAMRIVQQHRQSCQQKNDLDACLESGIPWLRILYSCFISSDRENQNQAMSDQQWCYGSLRIGSQGPSQRQTFEHLYQRTRLSNERTHSRSSYCIALTVAICRCLNVPLSDSWDSGKTFEAEREPPNIGVVVKYWREKDTQHVLPSSLSISSFLLLFKFLVTTDQGKCTFQASLAWSWHPRH